jgi:hypothetical protein
MTSFVTVLSIISVLIDRALAMEGCEIQGIFRDRLRVDGKLTNCETGDSVPA